MQSGHAGLLADEPRPVSLAVAWAMAPARVATVLLLACVAAAVSIGLQGFYFAVVNNSYHIPIVDGWFSDPQFATDQYIQSLRYHTSYVWPLARLMAPWLGTYATFLLLHVVNRLLMFVGFGLLLRQLGVRSAAAVAACMLTVAVTRYLLAASGPGEHDLFMPFLNHSSLTWPFVFASWLLLLRGRIVLALAMQGPVFAINAFVALCGGPAVAAGGFVFCPRDSAGRRVFAVRAAAGLGLAAAIALPTAVWIAESFTQPSGPPFSFLGFLHEYYLRHWYVTAATPRRLLSFVLVAFTGLVCLHRLGEPALPLRPMWWGYCVLFVAGAALPYLSDSRMLLVLHPMRVGAGCLVMLCIVAIVAHLGRAMETGRSADVAWAAASGLAGLAVGQSGLLLMTLAVAYCWWADRPRSDDVGSAAPVVGFAARPGAFGLIVAALLAVGGWRALREPPPYDVALLAAAKQAGLWIRANTPPGSMLLVPSGTVGGEDDPVSVWARRPLWYDWKEGAAVMWTPAYYHEWSTRRAEARLLANFADTLAYACAKHIDVLVETPDRLRGSGVAPAYRNEAYDVVLTAPLCPPR